MFLSSQKRACEQFLNHCKYIYIFLFKPGDGHGLKEWGAGLGKGHYRELWKQMFSNE